jgi:putative resolvase
MYLSAKQVKEMYKITSQTLYNWRKAKRINFKILPSGKYVYETLEDIPNPTRNNVLYARVSNTKQKDDLIRQQQVLRQYMTTNGIIVDKEYSDIASGMNESRPGFISLLKDSATGSVGTVYITYKDRLVRFGFRTIVSLLELFGTKIVVINATKEEDFQQELTQDFISIIHHFSMKMYSNRRKILKELQEKIKQDENNQTSI